MPERNLVAKLRNDKRFILLIALTIVTMQLGCTKFRQSTLGPDFLDSKRQPNWTSDSKDLPSHYDAEPDRSLDPSAERNDTARIVGVSADTIDSDSKTIKLVAHQPAAEAPCDHQANCDCFKKQLKPKLPYAEPIEPPSAVATMTPPTGLVSQPLVPLLFDAQTRAIQIEENSSNNSLRHGEQVSIEKDAILVKPDSVPLLPDRITATEIDVNPIRVNPADDRTSQPIRNYTWSDASQSEIANLSPPTTSNCPCDGPTCDGSCKTHSRRIGLPSGLPGEEPVQATVTVTNSTQPLPPFAECSPGDILENQESEFVPETDLAAVDTRSLDDLDDQQWVEIFGPAPAISQDCPRCTSKHCDDPDCGKALAAAISDFESEFESDDFQPPQKQFQASPIAVNSTEESNNDFSMASHTVAVGKAEPEIDLTQLAWPTVETTDPTPKLPEKTPPQTVELPSPDLLTLDNFVTEDSSPVTGKPEASSEPVKTENVEPVESIVKLQITNGALCTEVTGFGQFKPFPTSSFESGQRMLVYCEVENFISKETAVDFESQFVTRLRGSYAIHDGEGRVVQEAEYPIVEDVARNRRQDFYMHFPIQLGDLPPGPHRIELRVEDLNGNQRAALSTGMEFEVR